MRKIIFEIGDGEERTAIINKDSGVAKYYKATNTITVALSQATYVNFTLSGLAPKEMGEEIVNELNSGTHKDVRIEREYLLRVNYQIAWL